MKLFEHTDLSGKILPLKKLSFKFSRDQIPAPIKEKLLAKADAAASPVPQMFAHEYREFELNGNRTRMEAPYLARRRNLIALIMGEYAADDGRYIDALIDYIWAVCEESSWRLSAHNSLWLGGEHTEKIPYQLPFEFGDDVFFIDLFAAETGALLACAKYFLGEKFEKACPYCINERIDFELRRRIFNPFERYAKEQWWAGYNRPSINNWGPWIDANILTCVALALDDDEKRLAYTTDLLEMVDHYVKDIPTDGCNNEGVSYFSVSTGAVFTFIELLGDLTGGALDLHDNEIMRRAGEYIAKMNAGAYRRYVPFCDAPVNVANGLEKLYRYGKYFGSEMLTTFAGSFDTENEPFELAESLAMDNFRRAVTVIPRTKYVRDPYNYMDVWQIMTTRTEYNGKILYTAAKAGANNEGHGHNDDGSFVLYADAKPVLIDAGSPTYTKDTFNENRYKLWILQSPYHNTCSVDDLVQNCGGKYKCTDVTCENGVLSMELKNTLSDPSGITSLHRTVDASQGFTLTDTFSFETERTYKCFLMTLELPVISGNTMTVGGLSFTFSDGFDVTTERIPNEPDPRPARDYHTENICRTVFTMKASSGTFTLKLQ